MWCWSDENAACSRCHVEQDEDNHEWTKRGTHFQEVGEPRVCGSGKHKHLLVDHATGQCKAKRWFAVNFGKVKLAAMTMVNLVREIA